jgi:hypothetical protein
MKRERALVPSSFPSISSSQASSASSSPLALLRSTRKHIGLVLSTLAILGLITMVDLLVLPTLTKEASKVTQASIDAFHVRLEGRDREGERERKDESVCLVCKNHGREGVATQPSWRSGEYTSSLISHHFS